LTDACRVQPSGAERGRHAVRGKNARPFRLKHVGRLVDAGTQVGRPAERVMKA
jgi:hypothetical protein